MAQDIIEQLGGSAKVAEALGLAPNAVANWRKRDIPWRERPRIAELARKLSVTLPDDFIPTLRDVA
ncbi:MAG: YdaS family helix-turn-helix protein [Pseudomonadota bacterium]